MQASQFTHLLVSLFTLGMRFLGLDNLLIYVFKRFQFLYQAGFLALQAIDFQCQAPQVVSQAITLSHMLAQLSQFLGIWLYLVNATFDKSKLPRNIAELGVFLL